MFGSADLSIADQATKRSMHRAKEAAKQAEQASAKRKAVEAKRKK